VYDIFKALPNHHGSLDHSLVAGNYKEWDNIVIAIHVLERLANRRPSPHPIFQVQMCTHRKNSNHIKTYVSHTGPITEAELKELL
jgi:hypothetical protein